MAQRTPELIGMLLDITFDIVNGLHFEPLRGKGRNRVMRAKRWRRNVRFDDKLFSAVLDYLITGEMYFYMGSTAAQLKQELEKMSEETQNLFLDEDIVNPRFTHVASTTMGVDHTDTELTGYTQWVDGNPIKFNTNEIIRITYASMDGRLEGYTPLFSVPLHLELLWLLWGNQHDLQLKGNMPDYMVVAKDIKHSTQNLLDVEQKLQAYNTPGNSKHGMTVLYGSDYNFEKLERDTELQFADVGRAVTSILAGLYRYPSNRLNVKTEESAKSKDTPGDGERVYYLRISQMQDRIAEVFNTQLFEPFFGVTAEFEKGYLHDDLVEGQAMQWRLNNVKLLDDMLRNTHGKHITPEYLLAVYNNSQNELEQADLKEADMNAMFPGTLNNQLPDEVTGRGMPQAERDEKRQQQQATEKNRGKPTGV